MPSTVRLRGPRAWFSAGNNSPRRARSPESAVAVRRTGQHPTIDTWQITEGPTEVDPIPRDADECHWLWTVQRGDDTRTIRVVMSRTLAATEPTTLPSPIDQTVATIGRPEVLLAMERDSFPSRITIMRDGIITAD